MIVLLRSHYLIVSLVLMKIKENIVLRTVFITIFHLCLNCLLIYFILFYFIFPMYSKGVRLSLHVYITITFFPPPFVLLQHEYLDIVLNANSAGSPCKSILSFFLFFFFLRQNVLIFFFPLYSKGVRLCLHVYITITVFPPPFLLLQHEYLDIVLNAIQQDLLGNLF